MNFNPRPKFKMKEISNPLGLVWWCWFKTLDCIPLKIL